MPGGQRWRPRLRTAAARVEALSGGQVRLGPPLPPPAPHPLAGLDLTDRGVEPETAQPGDLVALFHSRLTDDDLRDIDAQMQQFPAGLWSGLDEHMRYIHAIPLSLWLGLPDIERRLNLQAVQTPPEIHHMADGPLWIGGGLLQADQIDWALKTVGAPLQAGDAVLDFGGSSGRIVRVFAGARPDVRWMSCDPNAEAVTWAQQNIMGVESFVSPLRPPMENVADDTYAAVYAVSIWSHFAEEPALQWLEEMRRVIRPGGHLVLSTHGTHSVSHYARANGPDDQWAIFEALYRDGFLYFDVFDEEEGDWGVPADGWGMTFMTPEWLQARITPTWSVRLFRPGAVEGNQDLYVLRRER